MLFFDKPSNNRDWEIDQSILPYAETKENLVKIFNIRNFKYNSTTDYIPNYYDKTFNLDFIKTLDYGVVPFSKIPGIAHTFFSFGFSDGSYISISVEIRKKKNEKFSIWQTFYKNFEIMYVVGDERDVLKLRTNYRKDKVYLYPIKISKEKIQKLFLEIILKINLLTEKPEFYNTFTRTCTSNLLIHTNKVSEKKIPFSHKILFPAYSDRLAYDLGFIDTNLSFEDAKKKFFISDKALEIGDDEDFSKKIREGF